MSNYDATAYYVGHYGKASAEDWVRWHQDGTWPSKRDLQSPTDYPVGDGHGVVYHMLAQQRQLNRVLDIGCSAGNFLLPITKICREAHGVDIAPFPGAWDVLRDHYNVHCQVFDFDKGNLPFPDGHFSAITMIMVLEHVFNVHHAVSEIARVLEPGGVAIVQVPNIAYLKRRLELLAGKMPVTADQSDLEFTKSWDGQHLHNFTLDSLKMIFGRFGLEIRDCRCFGRLAGLRSRWPSLLGADLTVAAYKPGTRRD